MNCVLAQCVACCDVLAYESASQCLGSERLATLKRISGVTLYSADFGVHNARLCTNELRIAKGINDVSK